MRRETVRAPRPWYLQTQNAAILQGHGPIATDSPVVLARDWLAAGIGLGLIEEGRGRVARVVGPWRQAGAFGARRGPSMRSSSHACLVRSTGHRRVTIHDTLQLGRSLYNLLQRIA